MNLYHFVKQKALPVVHQKAKNYVQQVAQEVERQKSSPLNPVAQSTPTSQPTGWLQKIKPIARGAVSFLNPVEPIERASVWIDRKVRPQYKVSGEIIKEFVPKLHGLFENLKMPELKGLMGAENNPYNSDTEDWHKWNVDNMVFFPRALTPDGISRHLGNAVLTLAQGALTVPVHTFGEMLENVGDKRDVAAGMNAFFTAIGATGFGATLNALSETKTVGPIVMGAFEKLHGASEWLKEKAGYEEWVMDTDYSPQVKQNLLDAWDFGVAIIMVESARAALGGAWKHVTHKQSRPIKDVLLEKGMDKAAIKTMLRDAKISPRELVRIKRAWYENLLQNFEKGIRQFTKNPKEFFAERLPFASTVKKVYGDKEPIIGGKKLSEWTTADLRKLNQTMMRRPSITEVIRKQFKIVQEELSRRGVKIKPLTKAQIQKMMPTTKLPTAQQKAVQLKQVQASQAKVGKAVKRAAKIPSIKVVKPKVAEAKIKFDDIVAGKSLPVLSAKKPIQKATPKADATRLPEAVAQSRTSRVLPPVSQLPKGGKRGYKISRGMELNIQRGRLSESQQKTFVKGLSAKDSAAMKRYEPAYLQAIKDGYIAKPAPVVAQAVSTFGGPGRYVSGKIPKALLEQKALLENAVALQAQGKGIRSKEFQAAQTALENFMKTKWASGLKKVKRVKVSPKSPEVIIEKAMTKAIKKGKSTRPYEDMLRIKDTKEAPPVRAGESVIKADTIRLANKAIKQHARSPKNPNKKIAHENIKKGAKVEIEQVKAVEADAKIYGKKRMSKDAEQMMNPADVAAKKPVTKEVFSSYDELLSTVNRRQTLAENIVKDPQRWQKIIQHMKDSGGVFDVLLSMGYGNLPYLNNKKYAHGVKLDLLIGIDAVPHQVAQFFGKTFPKNISASTWNTGALHIMLKNWKQRLKLGRDLPFKMDGARVDMLLKGSRAMLKKDPKAMIVIKAIEKNRQDLLVMMEKNGLKINPEWHKNPDYFPHEVLFNTATMSQLKNVVGYRKKGPSALKKAYGSLRDINLHLSEVLMRFYTDCMRASIWSKYEAGVLEFAYRQNGKVIRPKGKEVPPHGYVEHTFKPLRIFKDKKHEMLSVAKEKPVYLPKEVAADLLKTTTGHMNQFNKLYRNATVLFKITAIASRLTSYIIRNILGDAYLAAVAAPNKAQFLMEYPGIFRQVRAFHSTGKVTPLIQQLIDTGALQTARPVFKAVSAWDSPMSARARKAFTKTGVWQSGRLWLNELMMLQEIVARATLARNFQKYTKSSFKNAWEEANHSVIAYNRMGNTRVFLDNLFPFYFKWLPGALQSMGKSFSGNFIYLPRPAGAKRIAYAAKNIATLAIPLLLKQAWNTDSEVGVIDAMNQGLILNGGTQAIEKYKSGERLDKSDIYFLIESLRILNPPMSDIYIPANYVTLVKDGAPWIVNNKVGLFTGEMPTAAAEFVTGPYRAGKGGYLGEFVESRTNPAVTAPLKFLMSFKDEGYPRYPELSRYADHVLTRGRAFIHDMVPIVGLAERQISNIIASFKGQPRAEGEHASMILRQLTPVYFLDLGKTVNAIETHSHKKMATQARWQTKQEEKIMSDIIREGPTGKEGWLSKFGLGKAYGYYDQTLSLFFIRMNEQGILPDKYATQLKQKDPKHERWAEEYIGWLREQSPKVHRAFFEKFFNDIQPDDRQIEIGMDMGTKLRSRYFSYEDAVKYKDSAPIIYEKAKQLFVEGILNSVRNMSPAALLKNMESHSDFAQIMQHGLELVGDSTLTESQVKEIKAVETLNLIMRKITSGPVLDTQGAIDMLEAILIPPQLPDVSVVKERTTSLPTAEMLRGQSQLPGVSPRVSYLPGVKKKQDKKIPLDMLSYLGEESPYIY